MPVAAQFQVFTFTVLIGLVIGFIFDIYRVVQSLLRPPKAIIHLGDIFFWFIITVLVFLLLLYGNWGEVRFYVYVGLIIGFLIYLKFFSRYTIKGLVWLYNLAVKIINLIRRAAAFVIWVIFSVLAFIKKIILFPLGFFSLVFSYPAVLLKKSSLRCYWPLKRYILKKKRKLWIKMKSFFRRKK